MGTPQMRHRAHQAARIGVGGRVEDFLRGAFLHLAARVHHQHAVGHFRDHAKVMGNEQDGCTCLPLQIADQIEDLRLDGDIKRRGRFVGQ